MTALLVAASVLRPSRLVGVRDFRDLHAWRLSKELQRLVLSFLGRRPFCKNFKLRDQIDDAVSSAPRNIAEGFGRFQGTEFAQFLKVALGSLAETQNHLIDAHERGYITADELDRCQVLSKRAIAATTRLRAYLLSKRNTTSSTRTHRVKPP